MPMSALRSERQSTTSSKPRQATSYANNNCDAAADSADRADKKAGLQRPVSSRPSARPSSTFAAEKKPTLPSKPSHLGSSTSNQLSQPTTASSKGRNSFEMPPLRPVRRTAADEAADPSCQAADSVAESQLSDTASSEAEQQLTSTAGFKTVSSESIKNIRQASGSSSSFNFNSSSNNTSGMPTDSIIFSLLLVKYL